MPGGFDTEGLPPDASAPPRPSLWCCLRSLSPGRRYRTVMARLEPACVGPAAPSPVDRAPLPHWRHFVVPIRLERSTFAREPPIRTLNDKGKPVVRQGRKARGLEMIKIARLPKQTTAVAYLDSSDERLSRVPPRDTDTRDRPPALSKPAGPGSTVVEAMKMRAKYLTFAIGAAVSPGLALDGIGCG